MKQLMSGIVGRSRNPAKDLTPPMSGFRLWALRLSAIQAHGPGGIGENHCPGSHRNVDIGRVSRKLGLLGHL